MANTYLYRHIRKDTNQVFYVGVGTGRNYQRSKTAFGRNNIWKKIVNKTDYEVEIILDELDREFALEKEKEFIELYGRIDLGTGTLANLTEGGDGCIGFSAEVKKKMSEAQKGNQKWKLRKSNEHSRKLGLSNKGKKMSAEFKKNLSEINTGKGNPFYGKTHSEETKAKISKSRSKPIIQLTLDGEFVGEHQSAEVTKELGFTPACVRKVCLGQNRHHKNYIWKFKQQ